MTIKKKQFLISIGIFFAIFLAFLPVILSSNYIRQDDLMWEIWPGMKMSEFGYLYKNTVFQLVRPLCMISFFITDLISIDIYHAVYIRLLTVILIGVLGILLYFWQVSFNPNRVLAATFAIASFTLPAYQVFAATGNYQLIITGLLLTFGATISWYKASQSLEMRTKKTYYWLGGILFFASLLQYPLSSMYICLLLGIYYLNNINKPKKFFYIGAALTLSIMIFYYFFGRLVHLIFRVNVKGSRVAVIDTSDLFSRLFSIFNILSDHAYFWFWQTTHTFFDSPLIFIVIFFSIAIAIIHLQFNINSWQIILLNIVKSVTAMFCLLFLSYSPIFASSEIVITFRYTLVTMPLLLYLVFWSLSTLTERFLKWASSILFVTIACFGVVYANMMTAEGIVGPHHYDFTHIQQQLSEKVLPLLKQNKQVLIHGIACDENPPSFPNGVPTSFEYGMRICQYQQQVIGVIIHSMMKMGYMSNFYHHNKVIYNDNEIIVKQIPWGILVVNSTSKANNDLSLHTENRMPIITIDTRNLPQYQPWQFYKDLFSRIIS